MAMLLRKMWESVSNRSSSGSNSNSPERFRCVDSPLGVFEQFPADIVIQILRLLDPKEVAKLSLVCKAWRSLASDDRLWIYFLQNYQLEPWETIFFTETNLRSGHPLPTLVGQMHQLSFKRIYGLREQVPGAVVIDGGSGYCKYGWSKYDRPSGRSATFLEFGNLETPMYTRLRHFFATIYSRMQVKPCTQPVIVSIPICHCDDTESAKASRRQLKEAICAALFDMNVPAICAVNQATLALYAAKQTSGIAVNVGFQVTSIVPILNGKVMRKVGVEVVGLGAIKLTGFLRELMQQNNMNFESSYTVRTLKEKLCYAAIDYEAELSKDTQASFEAAGEGWFTLSKERFQTGEILFQPRLAGLQAMGLHQAVALCMDHCHSAELAGDPDWFKTVVLSGGTACLPGLAERLDKELRELLPPQLSSGIKVIPPPYGADTAWFGARTIGNLGGQSWTVELGRRDSTTASKDAATQDIPSPLMELNDLIKSFSNKGFTAKEMVTLSGAHTTGQARCLLFRGRIYNETTIDTDFATSVKSKCPSLGNDDGLSPLDVSSNVLFDNAYYKNLVNNKGLLHSDQQLFSGGSTNSQVTSYSTNSAAFFQDFAAAMVKMGNLSPLTGSSGQIRTNCRKVN